MRCVARGIAAASAFVSMHAAAADDAASFVRFVEEPGARCVTRGGMSIAVTNAHPKRTLRVWLDRYTMNRVTADRSRSVLKSGDEPEPLGCSRMLDGSAQEWRVVRAEFVD